MKGIFSAVLESVWKRKETKIFLVFALYPLIYYVASFFGASNFMQIDVGQGVQVGYLDFADMMLNSIDAMILPTLALYFLTISVFKRETDDHTMFLYKDINRKSIFLSKFFSLVLILVLYFILFLAVSMFVHYSRVVNMDFGSSRFGSDNLYSTLYVIINLLVIFLKGILSIAAAAFLSLRFGTGATMGVSIALSLMMAVTSIIGGPIAMIFPNGYNQFFKGISDIWIPLAGSVSVTALYTVICNYFSIEAFKNLEF
ncbi:hypothetical protein AB3331_03260 [Streptococcus sp. H49]|uniref:hypothetical protein n=1 Tax=Streptococcus huangxiaojuni TaxID=3237239 RepID=UPI0034A2FA19